MTTKRHLQQDYYKRACDVQLKDYTILFRSSEMYSSIDAAYNAYIDSYVDEHFPDTEVKIIHKDDLEANLEGVDNTIYELYRSNIDSGSIGEGNECFFVDIDGNGTPEVIAYLGNRLPFMYYIDSDGNVKDEEITALSEGTGGFAASY